MIAATGLVNLLLAPFGCYAINLAAITAAICCVPEAHEDPKRRYLASVFDGRFHLLIGLFGATVAALITFLVTASGLTLAGLGSAF